MVKECTQLVIKKYEMLMQVQCTLGGKQEKWNVNKKFLFPSFYLNFLTDLSLSGSQEDCYIWAKAGYNPG